MWKFKSLKGRDKWLFLLTIGAILCILAFPAERFAVQTPWAVKEAAAGNITGGGAGAGAAADASASKTVVSSETFSSRADCETALEARVRSVLEHVEGIGTVDVMIVQGPAGDSGSGFASDSVKTGASLFGEFSGSSGSESDVSVSDIQGIIISAEGGASPTIQAEISEAMQALFGLPAHKIKVLKRVE